MYWNNSWVNFFNKKNYLNKVLFLENIFYFLFSEKLFTFFFKNFKSSFSNSNLFKKLVIKKKNKVKNFFFFKNIKNTKKRKILKPKSIRYNFSRLWFIKYNNYILISTFVYFYFKIKKRKKVSKNKSIRFVLGKAPVIFWKKKKGSNFKKKLSKPHLNKFF